MRRLLILLCIAFASCNNSTKVIECRVKESKDSISYFYALPLTTDICYIYNSPTKLQSFYNIGWMPSMVEGDSIEELHGRILIDTVAYEVKDKDFGPLFKNIIKDVKENYRQ